MHEYIECEDNVGAVVSFKSGAIGLVQAGTAYKWDPDEIKIYGKIDFDTLQPVNRFDRRTSFDM